MKTERALLVALAVSGCGKTLELPAPQQGNGRVELTSDCGDSIAADANVTITGDAARRTYTWETGPLGGPPARVTLVDPRAVTCVPKVERTERGTIKLCYADFAHLGVPAARIATFTIDNLKSTVSQTSSPLFDAVTATGKLGHADVDMGHGVRGHDFLLVGMVTLATKDHRRRCTWRGDLIVRD